MNLRSFGIVGHISGTEVTLENAFLELDNLTITSDPDYGHLVVSLGDLDITDKLTPEARETAQELCREYVAEMGEYEQSAREDAADTRAQVLREERV